MKTALRVGGLSTRTPYLCSRAILAPGAAGNETALERIKSESWVLVKWRGGGWLAGWPVMTMKRRGEGCISRIWGREVKLPSFSMNLVM